MTKEYITFGDNGKGRVLLVGTVKVSECMTHRRVSLVKSSGYSLLSISQLLIETILCVQSSPRAKFSEPIFLSVLALLVVWLPVYQWIFGNGIGDSVT
jgi:hypothetical protein